MKKSRRRKVSPATVDLMGLRDEAVEDCRGVLALAELLESCDVRCLTPQTISYTGGIISHHARQLHERLEMLYEQLPKLK